MTIVLGRYVSIAPAGLMTQYIWHKKEDLSKRMMYGRAGFALLRQRVLHHL